MKFLEDWHTDRIPGWETHLVHFRDRETHGLEIGILEGRSVFWSLENILTHERSTLTAVDWFTQEPQTGNFYANLTECPSRGKLFIHRDESQVYLRKCTKSFDYIYIDADHRADSVMGDAVNAWPLLKIGGILIFDDYGWTHSEVAHPPTEAIDAFLKWWEGRYILLHKGWQVFVQKTSENHPTRSP